MKICKQRQLKEKFEREYDLIPEHEYTREQIYDGAEQLETPESFEKNRHDDVFYPQLKS